MRTELGGVQMGIREFEVRRNKENVSKGEGRREGKRKCKGRTRVLADKIMNVDVIDLNLLEAKKGNKHDDRRFVDERDDGNLATHLYLQKPPKPPPKFPTEDAPAILV